MKIRQVNGATKCKFSDLAYGDVGKAGKTTFMRIRPADGMLGNVVDIATGEIGRMSGDSMVTKVQAELRVWIVPNVDEALEAGEAMEGEK